MKEKSSKYLFTVFAGGGGAALVVLFFFDPATHGFYPQCALHTMTGLYCPGCGILRATHELLHGHVIQAFRLNALFVLSVPLIIGCIAYWCFKRAKGGEFPVVPKASWVWLGAAVIVCFGVVRNLPYCTLAWMRP